MSGPTKRDPLAGRQASRPRQPDASFGLKVVRRVGANPGEEGGRTDGNKETPEMIDGLAGLGQNSWES